MLTLNTSCLTPCQPWQCVSTAAVPCFALSLKLCHWPVESLLLHSMVSGCVGGGGGGEGGWFISLCCMSLLPTESVLASGHFNTWWLYSYELIEGRGKAQCYFYSCVIQDYNKTAYASYRRLFSGCALVSLVHGVVFPLDKSYCFLLIGGQRRKRSHFTAVKCSTIT